VSRSRTVSRSRKSHSRASLALTVIALVASSMSVGWAIGTASAPTSIDAAQARKVARHSAAQTAEVSARAAGERRGYHVGTARGNALARHDAHRDALRDASEALALRGQQARWRALQAKRKEKAQKARAPSAPRPN